MDDAQAALKPILLAPGQGRAYDVGPEGRFVFKIDADETAGRYSVLEVWLEPDIVRPPGSNEVNAHPQDHVLYVIGGTLSACIDGEWSHLTKGSFLFLPGGTNHTFENRGSDPAGFLSFNTPGGTEAKMPEIVAALEALRKQTVTAV